jgi:DNA-binding MarR family transcriptional regulator
MNIERQHQSLIRGEAASANLPPAMIEESAWDILLALHSDRQCALSLGKLASIASLSFSALDRHLAALEERRLVTGARHGVTGELRAILTLPGRELLNRYLSASSELQVGASR